MLAPLRDLGPAMDTFAVQPPAGIAGLHMDPPEPAPYAAYGMLLGRAAGRGDRRLRRRGRAGLGGAPALGRDPPRRRRDGDGAAPATGRWTACPASS